MKCSLKTINLMVIVVNFSDRIKGSADKKKTLSTFFITAVEAAKQAPYYRVLRNEAGKVIWLPCFRSHYIGRDT